MTAEKRNGMVVMALVLSLTAGVGVLYLLEPGEHHLKSRGNVTLMAESGAPRAVEEIEVQLASATEAEQAMKAERVGSDGICVVHGDRAPELRRGGPHVRLLVASEDDKSLPDDQKRWLLGALWELTESSRADQVRIRLAPPLDVPGANLSPAATDLRDLLVRKQLISS
jgi:hypothetical protein